MTKMENTAPAMLPAEQTQGRSLIRSMANEYGMEPVAFKRTIERTIMGPDSTPEELAAFLIVADKYKLNPITREIYAFPKRGGGIQPIVGIDGWMNLMNSHPSMDGLEFVDVFGDDGKIKSITCRIFRKDRGRPVEVTEYLAECQRGTEPWKKWPTRMLRHKAAIQCARYAFGFSGIMEPDEYERGDMEIVDHGVPLTKLPPGPDDEVMIEDETATQATGSAPLIDSAFVADDGTEHRSLEALKVHYANRDKSDPGPIPACLDRRGGDKPSETQEKSSKHEAPAPDDEPMPLDVEVEDEPRPDDHAVTGDGPHPHEDGFDLDGYRVEIENRMSSKETADEIEEIMAEVRGYLFPHVPDSIERIFDQLYNGNLKRIEDG